MFNNNKLVQSVKKFFLGNSLPYSGSWTWSVPGKWTKADLIKQYVRYVYAVVSAIAEEAAKVDFEVSKNDKPITSHPFLQLMKKPNPDQSQFQFLELHFTFMKLSGESYWYFAKGARTKKPKQVYLLIPSLMEVVVDKDDPAGIVKGYVMNGANGKKIPFERDEILHFKMPNPNNPYYGMGPVEAGKVYIETEEYASTWTKNSIYNSGRPSGVLSVKGTIGTEEFASIKKQFKENYTGTQNAGKTLLIKGADGMDYKKLGMELGEVALKELKDMTRDDVMVMFRVSKTILGISDDVNRANALEARAVFTRNIIVPELDRFIDNINAFLMPTWGDATLTYEDPTLQSDEDKLEEWKAGYNKWLTINDIRVERGLQPIKGGDVIYRPINEVPITEAGTAAKKIKGSKVKGLKKKDLREKQAEIFKQILFETQEVWEKKYQELIVKEFDIQEKEILSKNKKQTLTEWTFDVIASKQRLIGGLSPLSIDLLREAAKLALDMANDPDTSFQVDQNVTKFIHDRIERFAEATNDQTINAIEETIAQGIRDGESVAQLRKRIQEVYDFATDVRAERIARTETLAASNQGALEAYKQSPVVVSKEWSAEADACEFCRSLDGTVVGLERVFVGMGESVSGEDKGELPITYSDIQTPPLHPNCRCAILPVAN